MLGAILMGLMSAYAAYRLSLAMRAIQARRRGDFEREDQLRVRAFALSIGTGFGVVLFCVGLLFFL